MPSRDYEEDDFHTWVGYCITAWVGIDQRLFEIFWQILVCSKNHASNNILPHQSHDRGAGRPGSLGRA
jgi:hypothetical protein